MDKVETGLWLFGAILLGMLLGMAYTNHEYSSGDVDLEIDYCNELGYNYFMKLSYPEYIDGDVVTEICFNHETSVIGIDNLKFLLWKEMKAINNVEDNNIDNNNMSYVLENLSPSSSELRFEADTGSRLTFFEQVLKDPALLFSMYNASGDEVEVLEFLYNGEIYVYGELIGNNSEVLPALEEFLYENGCMEKLEEVNMSYD